MHYLKLRLLVFFVTGLALYGCSADGSWRDSNGIPMDHTKAYEEGMEQGKQEGIEQGKQEGIEQGKQGVQPRYVHF
jgi:hypothetical protein